MDKHFTLTYRQGIYSAGTDRFTVIGQVAGCDVRLDNRTPYSDVIFAKIIPNRDSDGWHLVKVTAYWPISVNGVEMNRVHYLKDGDVIDFPGTSCRFNIRNGRQETPSVVHVHTHNKLIWGALTAIVLLAAFVGYRIYDTSRENLTSSMQAAIEASLFTTRVDSLHLVKGDSIVDRYAYASGPVGTAFLSTDSLIVTARHCLQPWLNHVKPFEYSTIPTITDWPVAKALLAETENQLSSDTEYRIVSYLTLTDNTGKTVQLNSDQFAVNYEFDEIIELGDYSNIQYWRSISHRYNNQSMMLGDIAVAKYDKAGNIPLANQHDLKHLLAHKGTKLTFFGHPESGVNGNQIDRQADELRIPLCELENDTTHIAMLAHGGALTPGFSGGPVIVRDGMGFRAVGVISVIDEKNSQRSYSVPTSEIPHEYSHRK